MENFDTLFDFICEQYYNFLISIIVLTFVIMIIRMCVQATLALILCACPPIKRAISQECTCERD